MTASSPPSRRLLVSIHDVSPRFERQVDALAERLAAHLGGPRFAMLVIPDDRISIEAGQTEVEASA